MRHFSTLLNLQRMPLNQNCCEVIVCMNIYANYKSFIIKVCFEYHFTSYYLPIPWKSNFHKLLLSSPILFVIFPFLCDWLRARGKTRYFLNENLILFIVGLPLLLRNMIQILLWKWLMGIFKSKSMAQFGNNKVLE